MKSYNQYCPIARTSEFFAERWTPIIVRNLLAGCRTFTEIKAGAPGIPKALLSDRLRTLERRGVIRRSATSSGRGTAWELTAMGRDLKAVCDAMGEWGARWLELEPRHLDPAYAVWATCRLVDIAKVPDPGVVIRVEMQQGVRSDTFWMMLVPPRAEVCTTSAGRTEDLALRTDAATLINLNLRRITFPQALRTGRATLSGPPGLRRAFPGWIRPSPFAHITSGSDH